MKPRFWGVMVFLVAAVFAATPACGDEAYVVSADFYGNAAYMAPDDNGVFSGPEDLQIVAGSVIEGLGPS
ncbi:MAG: hypothetical protein JRH12_08200, partial [Deltaproteobacteria bacterium]|nr:hypothetical protein [Deltaproteobacteria bacterium]